MTASTSKIIVAAFIAVGTLVTLTSQHRPDRVTQGFVNSAGINRIDDANARAFAVPAETWEETLKQAP